MYDAHWLFSICFLVRDKVALNLHQGILPAGIPLTLYRHPSLLAITLVKSQDGTKCPHRADECKFLLLGQHWCVYVSESIGERRLWISPYFPSVPSMCCSYFLNMVCVMGRKWPYNCCFVEYCFQDLFKITRTILA